MRFPLLRLLIAVGLAAFFFALFCTVGWVAYAGPWNDDMSGSDRIVAGAVLTLVAGFVFAWAGVVCFGMAYLFWELAGVVEEWLKGK